MKVLVTDWSGLIPLHIVDVLMFYSYKVNEIR